MNNTQIAAIEIAQLRAALAESQRRERVLREAVYFARGYFGAMKAEHSVSAAIAKMTEAIASTQPGEGT